MGGIKWHSASEERQRQWPLECKHCRRKACAGHQCQIPWKNAHLRDMEATPNHRLYYSVTWVTRYHVL